MSLNAIISKSRSRSGFTLIELMVVMIIIALLVTITVAVLGFAQKKGRISKAEVMIKALSLSLEKYKNDQGEYPEPQNEAQMGDFGGENIEMGAAAMLYQAVSGDGTDAIFGGSKPSQGEPGTANEAYMEQARVGNNSFVRKVGESYVLIDPFGNPWQYRRYDEDRGSSNEPWTNNPTFDMWSYGLDETFGDEADQNVKWVTNW